MPHYPGYRELPWIPSLMFVCPSVCVVCDQLIDTSFAADLIIRVKTVLVTTWKKIPTSKLVGIINQYDPEISLVSLLVPSAFDRVYWAPTLVHYPYTCLPPSYKGYCNCEKSNPPMTKQCSRKIFMVHQTFVPWALYILFKFVKSHQTFGPCHLKYPTCPMIFMNTAKKLVGCRPHET